MLRKNINRSLFFLLVTLLHISATASAQYRTTQSGPFPSVVIAGEPFFCISTDGNQVPVFLDDSVYNIIGRATPGYQRGGAEIHVSPTRLGEMPPRAALFWFYHECGHAALPRGVGSFSQMAEVNADCFAIRSMVSQGFIRSWRDFQEVVSTVVGLAGTSSHLPGPQRAQLLANCTR